MSPTDRNPLEIDLLLTADERRTVTPEMHQAFRESIAGHAREYDEVDELVEALRAAESTQEDAP